MKISIIAAVDAGLGIGRNKELLYHIPHDMRRFQKLTSDKPVIMGRNTCDSIMRKLGGEPLAFRTNIVITDRKVNHPDLHPARSLRKALEIASDHYAKEAFVIGGASIYAEALPLADRLYLTHIHDTKPADTYFPAEYTETFEEKERDGPHNWKGLRYTFVTYVRKE